MGLVVPAYFVCDIPVNVSRAISEHSHRLSESGSFLSGDKSRLWAGGACLFFQVAEGEENTALLFFLLRFPEKASVYLTQASVV